MRVSGRYPATECWNESNAYCKCMLTSPCWGGQIYKDIEDLIDKHHNQPERLNEKTPSGDAKV